MIPLANSPSGQGTSARHEVAGSRGGRPGSVSRGMLPARRMGAESKKQMANTKINIHRYTHPQPAGFAGYVEPEDRQWVVFFDDRGGAVFFASRDPDTGAVLSARTSTNQ